MSKTDSTRPFWVQLKDPDFPWPIRAYHQCRFEMECDIGFPLPRTRQTGWRRCEYWSRWRDNEKIYGRPGYRRSFGSFQDRQARMDLRRLKARWLKETDREQIDSGENAPSRRWLWRKWYWD